MYLACVDPTDTEPSPHGARRRGVHWTPEKKPPRFNKFHSFHLHDHVKGPQDPKEV